MSICSSKYQKDKKTETWKALLLSLCNWGVTKITWNVEKRSCLPWQSKFPPPWRSSSRWRRRKESLCTSRSRCPEVTSILLHVWKLLPVSIQRKSEIHIITWRSQLQDTNMRAKADTKTVTNGTSSWVLLMISPADIHSATASSPDWKGLPSLQTGLTSSSCKKNKL